MVMMVMWIIVIMINGDPREQSTSMFMCVTPEALSLLAIMMYQGMCQNYLQEAKKYHDEKKV